MYRLVAYRYRAGTGVSATMKFSVLASDASEHRFAISDIIQQRQTDVEESLAAQLRSHHQCHVKAAQEVQIIVGRLVFQLEVNEVLRRAEKCGRNGWARNNRGADGNAQTIMSIWRQQTDQRNEFIGPLTTQLREQSP
jgi:hypothetical protein